MAFAAFIKIDGIDGDSTDDKHVGWINVLSYSHGVSQPAPMMSASGASRNAGRVEQSDFSFVHKVDKASPKLFLSCCKGEHHKTATFQVCRSTGDKQKFLEYKLSDVCISSVRPGGSAEGGEDLPLEEVSLNYAIIEVIYTETDSAGKSKGDIKGKYDVLKQVAS